jgi:hypothetical protein
MEGIRDCMEIADDLPGTRLVSVMDREADIFELFDEQRNNPCIDLLVRAKYNRCTTEQLKLFDAVKSTPVRQYLQIHVDRRSARPKRSKQKAQPKRSERVAEVALRYTQVELRPPPYHKDKDPIRVSIVHVVEESPPEGVKKLEWFLLTTIEVSSPAEAEDCLHWYSLRWRIEDWHRVLKTGCRIEELQHESAERLKRAIAINMVIAWRIMLMTLLGRETPELPMEVLFSDIEIQVLQAFAPTVRKPLPQCLKDAVTLTAMLGGYVMRRDPPGNQVLWRGYTQLRFMCIGFEIARSRDGPAGDVGYGQG